MQTSARALSSRLTLQLAVFTAAVGVLIAGRLLAAGGLFVLLVNLVFFPDLLDVLVRLYVRGTNVETGALGLDPGPSVALEAGDFSPYRKRLHLRPMALAASVHNAEEDVYDFIASMQPYSRWLWTIDDASTDETMVRLRQAGYRCVVGSPNRKKPGAIRELVAGLPPEIDTVVVFDPDCTFSNVSSTEITDLEAVVFDFQQSGATAVCPRVRVREDGMLGDFQGFEYCLSQLLGRKSLADYSTNSGVSIYRRRDLEWALARHSLSVYAEDLENSVILLGAGKRIYFDDRLTVETEGKMTLDGLFSQRVGWAYGHVRVFFERLRDIRAITRRGPMAAYQYLFYLGLVGILLLPLRALGAGAVLVSLANGVDELFLWGLVPNMAATDPLLFLTVYGQYLVLTTLVLVSGVPAGERRRYLGVVPLFVFYSFFLIVPTLVGFLNWVLVRTLGRRLYQDHYQDEVGVVRHANGHTVPASV